MPESQTPSSLFRNDHRSLDEKLQLIASIGAEAPETLTLLEVQALCRAHLRRVPGIVAAKPTI